MKALSLTQPWASLVALGAKKVETRSWSTPHRGPLAIHASKGFPREARLLCWSEPFCSALKPAGWDPELMPEKVLPLGCIVAVCELTDVLPIHSTYQAAVTRMMHLGVHARGPDAWLADREKAFGDYTPGRYMWLLSNIRALPKPIPARGKLGLFEVEIPGEEMRP